MNNNNYFMQQAIKLAQKGEGATFPNPKVGCVIVKNNKIIAEGYHKAYGAEHAEKNALLNTTESVEGASLYVNLEPCNHHGKQPPCSHLIVEKKIKKVYYGVQDTNPNVNGKGIDYLRGNGVLVEGGLLSRESWEINEDFLYYQATGKPLMVAKWASSIDGRIFTFAKESQWISNEKSRAYTHLLRNQNQAIMIGANSLKLDNPKLNVRLKNLDNTNNPVKIIVSSKGEINLNSSIFATKDNKIIVATTENILPETEKKLYNSGCKVIKTKSVDNKVNLQELIWELGKIGVISVLVEGGASLLKSMIIQNLINKAYVFIAPMIIGGMNNTLVNEDLYAKIKEAPKFVYKTSQIFDSDICVEYIAENYHKWKEERICSQG